MTGAVRRPRRLSIGVIAEVEGRREWRASQVRPARHDAHLVPSGHSSRRCRISVAAAVAAVGEGLARFRDEAPVVAGMVQGQP
jgi:hypothetical protein